MTIVCLRCEEEVTYDESGKLIDADGSEFCDWNLDLRHTLEEGEPK